jgi:hypothetical protein
MRIFIFIIISILFSRTISQSIRVDKPSEIKLNKTKTKTIDWVEYERRGDIYLNRDRFINTPITGTMLKKCARTVYDSIDVFIPVELALAQAQWESGMGLRGRTPKNNPCNLGEYTDKTVLRYTSTTEGMMAYYFLIARNYLDYGNKTIFDLFKNNMRDKNGYRYASSDTYGSRVGKQYHFIIKWINNSDKIK